LDAGTAMNGQGAAHGRWWVDRCNVRVLGQSAQDRWCQVEARYAISYPKEFTRRGREKLANSSLSVLAVLLQMKGDGLAPFVGAMRWVETKERTTATRAAG